MTNCLNQFLTEQAEVWGKVRVETVPGNHGRSGMMASEADNWDLMMYELLRSMNRNKYVSISEVTEADPFIRVMRIYDHGYLLYHGSAIKMYQTIPFYGIMQRLLRWSATNSLPNWSTAMIGHFHTCGYWQINKINTFLTGTMVTDDEWSLQTLGMESSSAWWLFGASHSRPVTFSFKIDLK
jgi:hypothetical protein